MATAANTRRSWLRPRFSLRAALLAFTAFAIGFPVWWRWPYEEREVLSPGPPLETRNTTWQRQWGAGRLKHGPEKIDSGNFFVKTTTYSHGCKNGPYAFGNGRGYEVSGQFRSDKKDGVWIDRFRDSVVKATWRAGQVDGRYDITLQDGRTFAFTFASGRIKEVNGKRVHSHLFDLLEAGTIDGNLCKRLTHSNANGLVWTSLHNLPFTLE